MNLPVYSRDGSESGRSVELDEQVFGLEPNDHVIWLDVRAIQAHGRQGTHKTKERGEVAKSRRKLYRQKGTGHARAGDARSPLRKGGGTIFGPKPHEYRLSVNKKTRKLARRSALAHKLNADAVRFIEDFAFDAPKTRDMADILQGHDLTDRKVLFLTADRDDTLYRSGRNLKKLSILPAAQASTLDLMHAQVVLVQEGALGPLTDALRSSSKPSAVEADGSTEAAEA
ncbi:MAG: 50S ribosomal protein L4 [Rhodothermaceae bacterium]|nr:50S ribosomal protein L4 [Rhodothermaceae bacterium]